MFDRRIGGALTGDGASFDMMPGQGRVTVGPGDTLYFGPTKYTDQPPRRGPAPIAAAPSQSARRGPLAPRRQLLRARGPDATQTRLVARAIAAPWTRRDVGTTRTRSRISSTTMQRRSFVQASVLGVTTSGLTAACGPAPQAMNTPAADDPLHARLAQLDREMEDLRCRPIDLGRVARKAANDAKMCREDPLDAQLYRSSLRALVLTAHIKDLSEADRGRPEVQARLDAHAAEVDFAVHGMAQRLAHMSPEEMTRVQDRLRRDPEMAERIVEYIDDEARKSDFPLGRRLRLRRLAKTTLWRLRRQPAELVIRETTDKLRRLTDRLGPIATREPFARPRAEDVAYWEAQTLRVVERYQAPEAATGDAATTADSTEGRRAMADVRRARAEALKTTDPAAAAEAFEAAATLYEAAARQLVESDEHRATRADLLDQAIAMYLQAYGHSAEPAALRLAVNTLNAHDEAFREAYAERRSTLPEYTRLQTHMIHVQGMLLRLPTPAPARAPESEDDFRAATRQRLLRAGGITAGVGLGLLALGLGLGFTVTFFGFILATLAGVALLAGIIVMIVSAAIS